MIIDLTSNNFPDCFYRVTVKGLLVRDEKLLVVEDYVGGPMVYELPGGGLDFEEDIREGFKREVLEEMGLEVTSIAEKPTYVWSVRRERARNMDWHYVLVLAYQFEVKNLEFKASDECRAIHFFSKEELEKNREAVNDQMMPLIKLFNPADFK